MKRDTNLLGSLKRWCGGHFYSSRYSISKFLSLGYRIVIVLGGTVINDGILV